jgi:hypothetical protein
MERQVAANARADGAIVELHCHGAGIPRAMTTINAIGSSGVRAVGSPLRSESGDRTLVMLMVKDRRAPDKPTRRECI